MTPQELKSSILQLAIQGRLVEQRPEEGTGEELYQQIQAEKQKLIQAGKIRKEKPLPEIAEDEVPFEIPESWKWVRVGAIFAHNTGKAMNSTAKKIDKPGSVRPFITTSNLYWNTFDFSTVKEMFFSDDEIERCTVKKGDLLMCEGGAYYGRTAIWNYDYDICFQNHVHRLRPYCPVDLLFFYQVFFLYKAMNMMNAKGTAMPGLSSETLHQMIIPLPPRAEQKRIVAKIEELLPYLSHYEKAWNRLEDFNRRFPADMQKSILQMAIQGKLVEQRPEEGTGEELYQQIRAEKQALIKAGKIKKEKPLPEIAEDEVPFEIPEGWKWVRVGEIFAHNTGKAMNSSAKQTDKKGSVRKFITTSNLYWNTFDLSSVKEMFFSDDELARCTATQNDLLMCEGGAYFGRTAIWPYDYDVCFQNHIHRLRPYCEVCQKFYYYIFFFYKNMNMMKAKGTAMPGLSSVVLHEMIVPLPPLAEQKRIVARLEEILPLCERLK